LLALDIRMPKLSGIDAALAAYTEMRIPSIIISACSDEEHVQKILSHGTQAGLFGYILKPVCLEQLAVSVCVVQRMAALDALD
jgi:response regulator of citrate/malate metabolism